MKMVFPSYTTGKTPDSTVGFRKKAILTPPDLPLIILTPPPTPEPDIPLRPTPRIAPPDPPGLFPFLQRLACADTKAIDRCVGIWVGVMGGLLGCGWEGEGEGGEG